MDKIFLAIPSYLDEELHNTVFEALDQAEHRERIFVSVFSQDSDSGHPPLQHIFNFFNIKEYNYEKINYLDAKGVGYARQQAQKHLSNDFKYYFQIDSHTRFIKNWDTQLINDYELYKDYWGDYIFTAYPPGYDYNDKGAVSVNNGHKHTCLLIKESDNKTAKYEAKYKTHSDNVEGDYHGYFCAGMAFGYSKHFLKVPYDPNIYFQGEEQTMSIRFYENDIKLIAPSRIYCYHNYQGTRRKRHWEKNDDWVEYEKKSTDRLHSFFQFEDLGIFGIKDVSKYNQWVDCFITEEI